MSSSRIDLRAEVSTSPTAEMWRVMEGTDIGWATMGEDASVRELEALGAEISGKEASLFVFTASVANVLALMLQTERGDQVILDADAHQVWIEGWNLAYICSVYPRLVHSHRGEMPLDEVEAVLTAWRSKYRPRTSLIAVENPHNDHGGTIVSPEYTEALVELAHRHGARVHLDGARIHNASVATGRPVRDFTSALDTVTISLNKGLGAPIGALLCGSRPVIEQAREHGLKWLGVSGMHRVGFLAAAALYSLRHMVDRLGDDHARAKAIADGIRDLPGLEVTEPETNTVRVSTAPSGTPAEQYVAALGQLGVLAALREPYAFKFVIHMETDDESVDSVIRATRQVVEKLTAGELVPGA